MSILSVWKKISGLRKSRKVKSRSASSSGSRSGSRPSTSTTTASGDENRRGSSSSHANNTSSVTPQQQQQQHRAETAPTTAAMERNNKYVPYVESTIMNDGRTTRSRYGRVNPAILGGFGDSDEDRTLPETSQPPESTKKRPADPPKSSVNPSSSEPSSSTAGTRQPEPEISQLQPRPRPPPTPSLSAQSTGRRGYRPLSRDILGDSDNNEGDASMQKTASQSCFESPSQDSSLTSYVSFATPPSVLSQTTGTSIDSSDMYGDPPVPSLGEVEVDSASFGKRYRTRPGPSGSSSRLVVSRERTSMSSSSVRRECSICAETRDLTEFPALSITSNCVHAPEACLVCVETSIRTDLNSKLWTNIQCPECSQPLEYADIQRYADADTFSRYEALALRAAMAESPKFLWCTSGCGSGQIHVSGASQPIVTCLHCGHKSCFVHGVAWHENLSCHEYDRLLKDPENFKSSLEIENEKWAEARRHQEDADRAIAQGLVAAEEAEIKRQLKKQLEERERARKAAEAVRKLAARRKLEEEQSRKTIQRTTKPCPQCGWAIEKDEGCSHMTCIKCRYEFCWGCIKPWDSCLNIRCRG